MADEESGEEDRKSALLQLEPDDEAELECVYADLLFPGGFSLESGELWRMDRDDLLYWTIMRHSDGFRVGSPERAEFDPQTDFMDFDDDYIELNDFLYPLSDADISG